MSLRRLNRIVLALCLALALPSGAFAGGLYRWVTKDGKVEVGPFPPPGVNAEPWQPEDENKPAPQAVQPTYPAEIHAPRREPESNPERERAVLNLECEVHEKKKADLARKRDETEQKIARLEADIARLEETLVANERFLCASDKWGRQKNPNCVERTFNRDADLERAQIDLEKAQSKLGDLEHKQRDADANEKCANLPAAPEP